jgi:transcriptional regulator with XRE-family HTH domain
MSQRGRRARAAGPRRRRSIRRLVRVLRGLQRDGDLTLDDMAARLGVCTSTLCMVYGGRRNPGPKFLRGVLEAFPHLNDEVCRFLLLDLKDGQGEG